MSTYTCLFYETPTGKSPVADFMRSLEKDTRRNFAYKLELLKQTGSLLRFPHTDAIGDGIFELRFKGKEGQIRVLFFFFYEGRIILTHGFVKKTQKTPKKEIEIAQQRMKEYITRHTRR